MERIHYKAGQAAAIAGGFRAAPSNLKIITQPWRDWYAGFDAAVQQGKHPKLTASFNLRRGAVSLS
jgi:hypothetical protein